MDDRVFCKKLAAGDKRAMANFSRRIDGLLKRMAPPDGGAPLNPCLDMATFVEKFWPSFKLGLKQKSA